MADLPKIVRQRLRQKPGEMHPDADLLTAFAERALGERERAQVLAHLAACADCREVVALARPQDEAEAAAAAPRGARGWVLRWQTAAALVTVAVAAVALLTIPDSYFRSAKAPVQVAKTPAAKPAAAGEEATAASPAAPAAAASRQQEEAKSAAAPGKKETVARGGGLGGGVPAVLAEADGARRDESKDKLSRGLPPPPPKEGQVASLTAEAGKQQPPPATYDFKSAQAAPAAPSYQPQAAGAVGGTAPTPGVAQQSEKRKVVTGAPAAADQARAANETVQIMVQTVAAAPLWRTSPTGRLERSPDAGRSWRTVTVSPGAVWNAVSAVGERVWVGGHLERAAILYYSADSGAHWTRLEFSAPAGARAADIVALSFTDAQHGVMTVVAAQDPSLRQIWTTADGGRAWTAPPPH